jgi:phosphonopyruvate decarboxylase
MPPENHKIVANEGSAIGLAMGYFMSTKKLPLVYMQNSGIGNAVNPLISLADKEVYSVPMVLMIGWRGEPGVKDEPQHVKQGMITEELLRVLGIPYEVIDNDTEQDEIGIIIEKQTKLALQEMSPVALLIKKGAFSNYDRGSHLNLNKENNHISKMSRSDFVDYYVEMKKKHIVVSTTGVTSRELLEARKRHGQPSDNDFLTVGGMGHASQIALGIAMNKPQTKTICLDGDGSLLMHMGSIAVVADSDCRNYHYILLNNSVHDSVGGQPIGAKQIDFLKVAESCGFKNILRIERYDQLPNLEGVFESRGPTFTEIIIKPGFNSDLMRPDKTPQQNKYLFEKYLSDCS